MKPSTHASLVLMILTLGLGSAAADTDTNAFIEAGTLTDGAMGTGGTGLVGFNFTVTASIDVTQLGFYGDSLGGGDTPWAALYDVTTSTQLAAITTFAPTNGWQYIALGTPVTLTAGDTYQIAATAYWSPKYADTSSFIYGSLISPVGASTFTTPGGWGGWGTPTMATNALTATPNITANFTYQMAGVPEPSSYAALVGLASLGSVMLRRRRR